MLKNENESIPIYEKELEPDFFTVFIQDSDKAKNFEKGLKSILVDFKFDHHEDPVGFHYYLFPSEAFIRIFNVLTAEGKKENIIIDNRRYYSNEKEY